MSAKVAPPNDSDCYWIDFPRAVVIVVYVTLD